MGFLSGWNISNRIKIKIQSDNITSDLINYPVLIKISTSSGINGTDLSAVFDELTSDANRKKIAITTDDGTTEIPIEIENWDDASELAWLWAKVPLVSTTNITILFLYYDSTHADNANVGDVTDAISQTVWDSNHKGVWHLDEDPTGAGSPMKDSTSNANHGSNLNLLASDSVTGLIHKAIDFDGVSGGVDIGAIAELQLLGDITLTAIVKTPSSFGGATETIIAKENFVEPEAADHNTNYQLLILSSSEKFRFKHEYSTGSNELIDSVSDHVDTNTRFVIEFSRDDTSKNGKFYVDGELKETISYTNSATSGDLPKVTIGYSLRDDTTTIQEANGLIEEVRIQDTVRPASWIKANNFNFRDTLIDYGVSATTFSDLIALPSFKKIQLAELKLAQRVDNKSWTQHGTFTNVYSIPYFEDTITLKGTTGTIINTANNGSGLLRITSTKHNIKHGSTITIAGLATAAQNARTTITNVTVDSFDCDLISFATTGETGTWHQGDTDTVRKRVTDMEVDLSGTVTVLTRLSVLASVDTTSNSFFHDVPNKILYVNINSGSNPETSGILITLFTLYFSTHTGTVFGNINYEPYIKNTPAINSASQTLLSGFAETTAGSIQFNNDNGYFDRLSELYLWENRTVTTRYGGDSLTFDEYETSFVGIISSREWSRQIFTLRLKSNQMQLLRRIPENVFDLSDTASFPDLDPNKDGNPIPIGYGTFVERNAPIVTAIDESVDTDQVQYQLTDHINNSIDNSWVDYNAKTDDADAGWKLLTLDAGLGSADTYKIDDAPTNKKITVRFQSGGYKSGRTKVKVAFKATEDDSSPPVLMTSPSDIVKDILKTYNGFADSDINLSEFATSKTNSANTIAIYIDTFQRTQEIIDKISVGEPAKFFVDNEGDFVLNVWSPDTGATFTTVDNTDDLGIGIKFDSTEFFSKVKVGYSFSYAENDWLYVSASDNDARDLYKENKQKVIFTYLDNSSDALVLAQRYLLLLKTPTAEVDFVSKWQLSEKKITDRIKITSSRAPEFSIGQYVGKIFEITAMQRDFDRGRIKVKCEDLKGILQDIGLWMPDSAPSWSGATEAERAQSGFWMNASGQATAGDPTSLNKSIWF